MKQHTVAYLFVTFFSCLSISIFTQAETDDDYKAEIMQHIVDPYFRYSAEKSNLTETFELDDAVELMNKSHPACCARETF